MAAPMMLSAIAAVAQDCIPAHAQEAAQKAVLQADVERTRLALERARMQGEDDRQKFVKRINALNTEIYNRTIHIANLDETIGNYEEADDMNCEYIQHLQEQRAILVKDIEKMMSVLDEQGTDSLDALGRVLEHTTPNGTETNDRKKFLARWFS